MGTLYVVSTPIGNLEDITIRAIKTLLTVEIICAEDTRHTGQLLSLLKERYAADLHITPTHRPQLISYYDEVEEKKVPEIILLLEQGKSIALVSDAGTPLIADPGYRLVQACLKRQIPVTPLPGPSSILAALPVSGFPVHPFLFLGYLPTNGTKRKKMMTNLATALRGLDQLPTLVCLESSHRLQESLADLEELLGDIPIALARELTKMHEQVLHGAISEVRQSLTEIKGEFVLMFRV